MTKYDKLFGEDWARILRPFLDSPEFKAIGKKLMELQNSGTQVYPIFDDVFRAFRECPWNEVSAVFLTNNPYIKESDGLAFSSQDKTPVLKVIFDAIEQDVADGLYLNRNPELLRWADQGVLLLNLDLTVDAKKTINHIELWKPFIDYVIKTFNELNTGIIYGLIGKAAEPYKDVINQTVNDVYLIEHPMAAVINKRPWRHRNIFSDISRVSKFLNNKEIKWT